MNSPETDKTKRCIACGWKIPYQAILCNKCNSFQKNWINILRYIAGIVGALTLMAGIITFIFTKIPDISKYFLYGNQLRIISFSTAQNSVISNISHGDIFLSHVELQGFIPDYAEKPSFIQTYFVDKIIKSKSIETHYDEFHTLTREQFKLCYPISDVTDEKWDEIISSATLNRNEYNCYFIVFISPEDRLYLLYKKWHKDALRTFKARAFINYYSIYTNRKKIQEIPMIGLVFFNPNSACNIND